MRESDVITNRTAAAAGGNHRSHSDGAFDIVEQRGEQQEGVSESQSMLGEISHLMVAVGTSTSLSHNDTDNVMDVTAAAASSSSSGRINSRVNRYISSSSCDAPPHPSDKQSTQVTPPPSPPLRPRSPPPCRLCRSPRGPYSFCFYSSLYFLTYTKKQPTTITGSLNSTSIATLKLLPLLLLLLLLLLLD